MKKENKNIVLLNKDGSVEVIKKESKLLTKDYKYVLIPITGFETDTFMILKPKKKLWDFTVAYIEYTLQYKYFFDDELNYTNFKPIKKEIRGIVDLMNFLHSLDRIDYVNYFINYEMRDDINITDVEKFNIKIFKDNDLIYNYKYEAKYGNGYSDKSNCEVVLIGLKDLYYRANEDVQAKKIRNSFINIRNNKWSFDNYPQHDSIVGINMLASQSIYFTENDIYDTFTLIDRLDADAAIFNRDEMPDEYRKKSDLYKPIDDGEIETYLTFPISMFDTSDIIEFILYLKFIYTILVMEFNFIIYDIDDIQLQEGFDLYISFIIRDSQRREFSMNAVKEHIPTLEEFFKKILNMRR